MNITHKQYPAFQAVTIRKPIQQRAEIKAALDELAQIIPTEQIAGPPFCIFNFITSIKEGYDVTLGIPVTKQIQNEHYNSEFLPKMEALTIIHRGESERLGETIGKIFAYAGQHAIIADEFYREVYLSDSDPNGPGTEIQFVIHNWYAKLATGLERVLDIEACRTVMQGSQNLKIESGLEERFEWVKGMLTRLDALTNDHQKWDVISSCAHEFPQGQIDKLAKVFNESRGQTGDSLQAVDAVIAFMDADPGWSEGGVRKGHTIYTAKKPRDAKAYSDAKSDLERRQAYCFCPLVRTKMDQGMPFDFCNCGSGWFRQQWEGATGKPVTIEIVQTVLLGDEKCEFAVHLAKDI